MHVHVLGAVTLNGGDAAIMAAQVEVLRSAFPGVSITISEAHPSAAGRYEPTWRFTPWLHSTTTSRHGGRLGALLTRASMGRLKIAARVAGGRAHWLWRLLLTRQQRAALRPVVEADIVAHTGGTTLTENYDLNPKLYDMEVALLLGKPLVFLPQSAGPFRSPANRQRLARIFAASEQIVLRDERSLQHVLDVGAPEDKCRVAPDMAFALVDTSIWRSDAATASPPRVCVSVRPWSHFQGITPEEGMRQYTGAISDAVTHVVRRRGALVTFLSTCQGRPEYWIDDSALASSIRDGLPDDVRANVVVDRAAHTPRELRTLLVSFDAMLSTRLHGALLGVSAGCPVVPVAYEFKTREVWRQMGLEEWVVDIEDCLGGRLAERLDSLLDEREDVVSRMREELPHQRDAAFAVGDALRAVQPRESR